MGSPLISVIVCAYNEGNNINNCLLALSKQNFNNYEIIIVDDGTDINDPSIQIMDQYEKKYENIVVIHKENSGSISARMTGVKNSRGKYVTFVDADDFVSSDYIKVITKIVNYKDADLYQLNNKVNKKGKNQFETEKKFLENDNNVSVNQMYEWILTGKTGAVWDKIYKRELFPEISSSIFFGEDVFINANYLKCIKNIVVFDYSIYYHIIDSSTSGSTTSKSSYKKFLDIDDLYVFVKSLLDNSFIDKRVFEEFIVVYLTNIAHGSGDLFRLGLKQTEITSTIGKLNIVKDWLSCIKTNNFKKTVYIWCLRKQQYRLIAFIDKVVRG